MAVPLSERMSPPTKGGGVVESEEAAGGGSKRALKYFKVVHRSAVAVHETMSLASAAVSFKQPGSVVKAVSALGGNGNQTQERDDLEEAQGEYAWVKLWSGEGYMLAKHPVEGRMLDALAPSTFKVVHKAVLVRKDASTSSPVLQIRKQNDTLLVDGHLEGWLKVHNASAAVQSIDGNSDDNNSDADPFQDVSAGWVLLQHPTYGKLVQYMEGETPTFGDVEALEGSLKATPSSVYTGKVTDPFTERMKVELNSIRSAVQEKETEAKRSGGGATSDVIRRGLMSNAGQSSSHSFCIAGNPL